MVNITEDFNEWLKSSKSFSAPISEWNKATLDICRKMTQQNLDLFSENISRLSNQMKQLSSVKDPKDYFNVMKNCINEDITATVNSVQKLIHTSMQGTEELTKLCGTMCESTMQNVAKKTHQTKEHQKE